MTSCMFLQLAKFVRSIKIRHIIPVSQRTQYYHQRDFILICDITIMPESLILLK